jgi:hypothetical protein
MALLVELIKRAELTRIGEAGAGWRPAMSEKITPRHLERRAVLYVRRTSA